MAWLYGCAVFLRNKMFKYGLLKSKSYNVPIICVGNLSAGGTGKTPHIEYLIELLKDKYKVAVLSRGYMRKTSGFVLASDTPKSNEIGDEPCQIKLKFPNIIVAVSENRCNGIEKLLNLPPEKRPQVILLDDAYQHRYVKPSYSILLTDFHRPYYKDELLPAGRLREPAAYSECANMIIVTKCPPAIKPIDLRILQHDINAFPYQSLLYTSIKYDVLKPIFNTNKPVLRLDQLNKKQALLISGIASPKMLIRTLRKSVGKLEILSFADHHNFSKKDITKINNIFKNLNEPDKLIVVTEKDAARLRSASGLTDEARAAMYSLPIRISFVSKEDEEMFNTKILEHVRKNTRNSHLHQK